MEGKIGREAILLGTIAQVMPDPTFILDKDGVYLEVIGGKERSLYGSSDYLRGKCLNNIFRKDSADRPLQPRGRQSTAATCRSSNTN